MAVPLVPFRLPASENYLFIQQHGSSYNKSQEFISELRCPGSVKTLNALAIEMSISKKYSSNAHYWKLIDLCSLKLWYLIVLSLTCSNWNVYERYINSFAQFFARVSKSHSDEAVVAFIVVVVQAKYWNLLKAFLCQNHTVKKNSCTRQWMLQVSTVYLSDLTIIWFSLLAADVHWIKNTL